MPKMTLTEAASILNMTMEEAATLAKLEKLAYILQIEQAEFMTDFNFWVGKNTFSVKDGADLCYRRVTAGLPLPWEEPESRLEPEPEPEQIYHQEPWNAVSRAEREEAKSAPRLGAIEPGDYITYKAGGPVYRVKHLNTDGTLRVERLVEKWISRPEDFRLIQKGNADD